MKTALKITVLLFFSLLFSNCGNKDEEYIDPRGAEYAGAESCIQCHKTIHESSMLNAHYSATAEATPESVKGDFNSGKNVFIYDQNTKLVMENRDGKLFQVLYSNGKEERAYPFDIVFGIRNAQTSVFARANSSYELPISYYSSLHGWATSPGFSASTPYFERNMEQDCYACHISNVTSKTDVHNYMSASQGETIDKKAFVYGIDCERCHGPAKKHVDYHIKFPKEKAAHDIVSFKNLTNQQKLDACALCHSGMDGLKLKSKFLFRPGDHLSDFYRSRPSANATNIDVHGNQTGLLSQSQCFIKSETMNCVTCHNPHERNPKSLVSYSKICLTCHNGVAHTETTIALSKNAIKDNCIECHMPKQSSRAIKFQTSKDAKISSYILRTHKIAVYPAK